MRQKHKDQNYCNMLHGLKLLEWQKLYKDPNCRNKNYRKLKLAIDSLTVMSVSELSRKKTEKHTIVL